jgi:glucose/arabinose dehydrogenase
MRARRASCCLLVLPALLALPLAAHSDPLLSAGFVEDNAAPGAVFVVPTAIAFLPDGRFLVAEKRGRVYEVRDGIRQPNPIWSGENEVLDQHDRGVLGLAVDPNYFVNHYIYLYYTVDPDSDGSDLNDRAFNRLTRYRIGFGDSSSVDTTTRTVLLGVDWPSAPVSASDSHTGGCLRWGADGSLLLSIGDGAEYTIADAGGNDPGQFGPGLSDPSQDIGAYRAQDITGLNGKVLRLNPATGQGYASNPYFDGDPSSPRSKVWCYGLRNPFRFTVRPGTGAADPAAGDPGSLYIGDVGWDSFEEVDVARFGGLNFGWPCFEGPNSNTPYLANPPSHNGCDSFGTSSNPEEPTAPFSSWQHLDPSQGDPPGFIGNCAISGVFYTGNRYPPAYQGQYFFADYGQGWIKVAVVDTADQRLKVLDFASGADSPVDFAAHPLTGDLYYVSVIRQEILRIRYLGAVGGNLPPIAAMHASPSSGPVPLAVQFTAAGSSDPEGGPLQYRWLFGDGESATGITTTHVYQASGVVPSQLTVTDDHGNEDVKSILINVSPSGGGFPETNVLDNFNRLDGPVGSPWTDNVAGLVVIAGGLRSTSLVNSAVWNGEVFGPNQEAFVTLATPIGVGAENLLLKVQDTTATAGCIEVKYDPGAGRVAVSTSTPAGGSVVHGLFLQQFQAGDRFGARADSVGAVRVFRNGEIVGEVDVSTWAFATAGGRIGLSALGLSGEGVLDDFGGGDAIPEGESPPRAMITLPVDGSTYYSGQIVNLGGSGLDVESPPQQLQFRWAVDLYHNNHIHPSVYTFTGPHAAFPGMNHDDGTGVHMLVKLTAMDPQGQVSDTAYATIWPEIDLRADPIQVNPETPLETQSALYTLTIHNDGRMPAPISHWALLANDVALAQGDTVIRALDSLRIVVKAALPTAGFWTLRLVADSTGAVHELDEDDNVSLRALTVVRGTTDVPDALPARLELSLPAPNPSHGEVSFALALPRETDVELRILDLQGRVVHQEAKRRYVAGRWSLTWDGRVHGAPAPPGVYLARILVGEAAFTRRIALIR